MNARTGRERVDGDSIPMEGVPTLSRISASMPQELGRWATGINRRGRGVTQGFYFTAKARSYEDFLMGAG